MVGLIDCDNFFCSCERVFRPDLARKPIVVLSNNDGCVVARSREVKAIGVPEGMPYYQMLEQYPDSGIVAFSSNYTLYGDMSARIMSILAEETPGITQYSIDEAFLNLEGINPPDGLRAWGERLCARILKGTGMPVSLGIGPSKTLAKLASKFAKKYPAYRKSCEIATDIQRRKALSLTGVRDVWGIGRRIGRRLEAGGIHTALDFASRPREWVRSRFHIPGERTWAELNGEDLIDVDSLGETTKKSILTSRSFPGTITTFEELRAHVANYAARCGSKLRRQHSVCGILSVFVQSNHFREDLAQYDGNANHAFMTPTSTTTELVEAATEALHSAFRPGIHYKRAGVMVSAITPDTAIQPDLFSYDPERARKLRRMSAAIDLINGRNGADTIVLGAQQYIAHEGGERNIKFANAIRRAMKSPDYTTKFGAFVV